MIVKGLILCSQRYCKIHSHYAGQFLLEAENVETQLLWKNFMGTLDFSIFLIAQAAP
jgi:hypothetical protein